MPKFSRLRRHRREAGKVCPKCGEIIVRDRVIKYNVSTNEPPTFDYKLRCKCR